MSIFNWLIVVCWLTFLAYWIISAASAKKNLNSAFTLQSIVLRLAIAAAVVALLGFERLKPLQFIEGVPTNTLEGSLGVVLCAAGVAFAIWARAYLGSNWGMPMSVKENPELVTSGPYAYVRHPIYTGVLTAILGLTLVAGPWWLVIFAAGAITFIYSAKMEERLMLEEFPAEYAAYKRRTNMLIPFVF